MANEDYFPRDIKFDDIREGDKIEITYTDSGEVVICVIHRVIGESIQSRHFAFYRGTVLTYTYRLLSRPKPKPRVGDSVPPQDVINLPSGTIVRGDFSGVDWLITERGGIGTSKLIVSASNNRIRHEYFSENNSNQYIIRYLK